MMADMAIRDFIRSEGGWAKIIWEMYSLPISATPEREAALDMRMMQLMAKAMEGW
jgi:hypothetical protein